MILFEELVRIYHQMFGKENIFGYKTTVANQLYLMYCFLGKIHTTDKLHRQTKCVWLLGHYLAPVTGYLLVMLWGVAYLLDGSKQDFLTLLYTTFLVALATTLCFGLPLSTYWFRLDIESMIQRLDDIVAKRPNICAQRKTIHVRKMIMDDFLFYWTPMMIYTLVCCFDVIFFFKEEKLHNILYYPIPFPYLYQYGSAKIFFSSYFVYLFICFFVYFESYSQLIFLKTWAALCYNEVMFICDDLNNQSRSFISCAESADDFKYRNILVRNVDALQKVNRVIGNLKQYFQLISSLLLPATLVFQIVHAYAFLSEELPNAVICKEISVFMSTGMIIYSICWVGETLDSLAAAISYEVYCTPWYHLSPLHRRNIHIFLCQTQRVISLRALEVYPLNMQTFRRFNNFIYSSVNFLRNSIGRN